MTHEIHRDKGIKCCTFGATNRNELAYGDFDGKLEIIDLET